jgi:hypothetical protein
MMQKLFLIADSEGSKAFDASKLRKAIEALTGATGFREGKESIDPENVLLEIELETGEDGVIPIPISVSKNLGSVSVGAYHDKGLNAALEIQRRYGEEVFAFSEESSPHVVPLSTIKSPQELAQSLKLR